MAAHGDQDTYAANASFWVKIIHEQLDRYRTELTDAAVLSAVDPCEGLQVLDGGCGEGYLSRMLAKRGAIVTGIDTSAALISAAIEERDRLGLDIDYNIASLDSIPAPNGQFDIVVCNHVVSDIVNPEAAFKEISRVTKSGGKLVLLMLHPCFYTAHAERDATGGIPVEAYFSTRKIAQKFEVAGITSPAEVHMNFRSLEHYMSLIISSGYVVTRLSEPHPSTDQLRDEWWRKNFSKPLFMLVAAERR